MIPSTDRNRKFWRRFKCQKNLLVSIVSCALVLSLALVGVIGVSAAIDTDGRYVPSEGVKETHKVYFLMPESWKSEKYNAHDAGAYWWNGSDPCGSLDGTSVGPAWPGYKMQVENAEITSSILTFLQMFLILISTTTLTAVKGQKIPQQVK